MLEHLFNWSRLEMPSQGWAWEDAMSPSLSLAVTVTSYVFIYLDADRSFRYLMKQARICEKIEEKSLKKVFLDTAERVCKL